MRKLKKAFSLTLALALSLALAVPAFADSANGYTDPSAENVEFSVTPIGVATIRWVSPWYTEEYTAYVFDQDCTVTRKDGLPFKCFGLPPMYGDVGYTVSMGAFEQWAMVEKEWDWVEAGSAGIRADNDNGWAYQFAPEYTGEGEFDWSPYMISKKSIDTVFPYEYEDEWTGDRISGTVVEYRPLSAQPTQPTQPTQPATPDVTVEDIPASGTAKASTQTVTVDGRAVEFQMYALLDANGNGTNYVKLRDMAHVLNGTEAQFSVGYSNETGISATSGQPYQDTGSEMNTPFSGDQAYTGGGQSLQVNGKAVTMTAISLLDANGGGYTYFKLRDLGAALGFNVGWSAERGVYVETDKPYAG